MYLFWTAQWAQQVAIWRSLAINARSAFWGSGSNEHDSHRGFTKRERTEWCYCGPGGGSFLHIRCRDIASKNVTMIKCFNFAFFQNGTNIHCKASQNRRCQILDQNGFLVELLYFGISQWLIIFLFRKARFLRTRSRAISNNYWMLFRTRKLNFVHYFCKRKIKLVTRSTN